jgi:hypothetical protein
LPNYQWWNVTLSSALNLSNGATYRVNLYSAGSSSSSNCYQVLRNDNTNSSEYNGRNYNGTGSVYAFSANSGTSWNDTGDQYDIPFRLEITPKVSITQYDIDTTDFTGIVFSYNYWGGDTGTNPQLQVEWKPYSSGTWNTLATHTLTSSTPTLASWNLPAGANNASIDIRFTDLTVSTREARVDNVKVTCNVPISFTPVCMPDDNEGTDFFTESWHSETYYLRWELDWNFSNYPAQDDPLWDKGGVGEGYPYTGSDPYDYDPYLELQPGEIFQIVFQATVTLDASGSYYDEVFVRIGEDYWDDNWIYSWPTGEVSVPQYDLQAQTLNSILRASAMLQPNGYWWRSWHWHWHR